MADIQKIVRFSVVAQAVEQVQKEDGSWEDVRWDTLIGCPITFFEEKDITPEEVERRVLDCVTLCQEWAI